MTYTVSNSLALFVVHLSAVLFNANLTVNQLKAKTCAVLLQVRNSLKNTVTRLRSGTANLLHQLATDIAPKATLLPNAPKVVRKWQTPLARFLTLGMARPEEVAHLRITKGKRTRYFVAHVVTPGVVYHYKVSKRRYVEKIAPDLVSRYAMESDVALAA